AVAREMGTAEAMLPTAHITTNAPICHCLPLVHVFILAPFVCWFGCSRSSTRGPETSPHPALPACGAFFAILTAIRKRQDRNNLEMKKLRSRLQKNPDGRRG